MLELRPVPFSHPDALAVIGAVQQVYVERYGDGDLTPVDPGEFAPPLGWFVVGYVEGVPVAGGGWRGQSAATDPALCAGDAEIKRMYVADGHRGRGFARAMLAELERAAAAAGRRRMVLETGTRQPEAIGLYRSAGYLPMPRFGLYRDHAGCRCFAKPLPAHPTPLLPGDADAYLSVRPVPGCSTGAAEVIIGESGYVSRVRAEP